MFIFLKYCESKSADSLGEALAILFGAQRIHKWKTTNISRNVDADGHQSKFVQNIIKQVLQEVNHTPLEVACYPVEVDTRVKDTELLLRNDIDQLHTVGMGGIGKTNWAKRYLQPNILIVIASF